jgi:hypothetical protein
VPERRVKIYIAQTLTYEIVTDVVISDEDLADCEGRGDLLVSYLNGRWNEFEDSLWPDIPETGGRGVLDAQFVDSSVPLTRRSISDHRDDLGRWCRWSGSAVSRGYADDRCPNRCTASRIIEPNAMLRSNAEVW